MNLETMQKMSQRVMNGQGLIPKKDADNDSSTISDVEELDSATHRRYSDENREID
jgi:hypothetical protein